MAMERWASACPLIAHVRDRFEVKRGWKIVGQFRNQRKKFEWQDGLKIELDHTAYAFGSGYEIEIETDKPEAVRAARETNS
jgi:hypothetical protein